jgi:hypothetical protein
MAAIRRTAGGVFGKDLAIELIQNDHVAAQPRLLIWNGEEANVAERFTHNDITYQPIALEPAVASAIRFPPRIEDYHSTRKLFDDVCGLIARVTRLPKNDSSLLAFFVFATWLGGCLPKAPFLWIMAPDTVSWEPLVHVLGLLCRHTIFINELSISTLRSLPMELRPTVVTEAPVISRSLLRAIHASSRLGSCDAADGKVQNLFCVKVICARQPLAGSTITGLPLEITLAPAQEHVPRMETNEAERVAAEFQPKLLMYRLMNYGRVRPLSIDLSHLTAPVKDLAQILAMPIVADQALQRQLLPLLEQRNREVEVDRTLLLESIVLDALLAACHQRNADDGCRSVIELAKDVNTILSGRGDGRQVSPETVGWKLRALGFHTDFINGGRKGLLLLESTRVRIHQLAAAYKIRTFLQKPETAQCRDCFRIIEGDLDGEALRK